MIQRDSPDGYGYLGYDETDDDFDLLAYYREYGFPGEVRNVQVQDGR